MSAAKITALEALVTALTARVDALEKTLAASASVAATNETTTTKTKEVKEKTPRGKTGWSLFFKHVSEEMKKANPDTKYKLGDFVAEAKKRKENGDYDEAHWKAEAAKINTAA
jgi:leucyl aminopeptidase (aminopeptidase T)